MKGFYIKKGIVRKEIGREGWILRCTRANAVIPRLGYGLNTVQYESQDLRGFK